MSYYLNAFANVWLFQFVSTPGWSILIYHFQANLGYTSPFKETVMKDNQSDNTVLEEYTDTIKGMWWRHLLSGAIAGSVSRTCTAPLDRIKVTLQVRGTQFNGMIECLKYLMKEGGIRSFWRGNGMNVIKITPENALKFMSYDLAKQLFQGNSDREICFMERFLSGAFAGGFSQTVIYPMELLKTRLCLRCTGQYSGIIDAFRKIHQKEGISGFYKGYVPNLVGVIFYAGIDLALYEKIKRLALESNIVEGEPGFSLYLCCGLISSSCGQLTTYPLALVRTRLQAKTGQADETMRSMFRKIFIEEGITGFYRGIMPNFIKVIPSAGITYIVYEKARGVLGATMT